MGKQWLEWWIRHTLVTNRGTPEGDDFLDAFDIGDPLVTAVVSMNLKRNREFKIAAQVFVARDGYLFDPWPTGF
jgi:predicted HAD superfamily hydrolase